MRRKGVGRDRAWWGFAPLRDFLRFEAHKTWEFIKLKVCLFRREVGLGGGAAAP